MARKIPDWLVPGVIVRWQGLVGIVEDVCHGETETIIVIMWPKNIIGKHSRADWIRWENLKGIRQANALQLRHHAYREITEANDLLSDWLDANLGEVK